MKNPIFHMASNGLFEVFNFFDLEGHDLGDQFVKLDHPQDPTNFLVKENFQNL